jgi:hypothetical protein
VFVDVSRNGTKRFCSTACQNRVKAAAFRARQRERSIRLDHRSRRAALFRTLLVPPAGNLRNNSGAQMTPGGVAALANTPV